MIYTTNINNPTINPDHCNLAITRKNPHKEHILHTPELAPSPELYNYYLNLKKANQWNATAYKLYTDHYRYEILTSPKALDTLHTIISRHEQKQTISLLCYCTDPNLCHRTYLLNHLIPHIQYHSNLLG